MKNLVECPDCTRQISAAAEACPQCGRPMRTRQTATGMLAAMVLPFFILMGLLILLGGGLFVLRLLF
jgi:primosomal protein N'